MPRTDNEPLSGCGLQHRCRAGLGGMCSYLGFSAHSMQDTAHGVHSRIIRSSCGPSRLVISVYAQEGLHVASLLRRQAATHHLYYCSASFPDENARFAARSLDWCVGFRCVSHTASSAIRWGLSPHASEGRNDDAHLLVKGLINSADPLFSSIPVHITRSVVFEDSSATPEQRKQYWSVLGVADAHLPLLLEVDPRWSESEKVLRVRAALRAQPDHQDKIHKVIMYCMRWDNWCDTVGRSW